HLRMECMTALFICHCSPSWLGFPLCTLGPKTASGAYWHKSILSQHHLRNWSGKSSLTFMSVSPQCLLQESQTAQPSVSLLCAVFCVLFPRQNGCGFRFYRCSAYPFFGEQWEPTPQALRWSEGWRDPATAALGLFVGSPVAMARGEPSAGRAEELRVHTMRDIQ
uniref:Uncharacterized protein n=1 Tax=Geospiza parvula TaxID=87175 RepID=A0A8C3M4X6_GEOPR